MHIKNIKKLTAVLKVKEKLDIYQLGILTLKHYK
jgi:hypothetical protein